MKCPDCEFDVEVLGREVGRVIHKDKELLREGTEKGDWADTRKNENNLCYWFPTVLELDIPTPETILVSLDQNQGRNWLEGTQALPVSFKPSFEAAADNLGWPVFIRTDSASGKHEWASSCFVKEKADLFPHLSRVIEFNEMADILGLNYCHIAVRRYLQPNHKFTAFEGMPVSHEYRVFADNGQVKCLHPYWFPEALNDAFHKPPLPKNWKMLLQETYAKAPMGILHDYASKVTEKLGGYWSVDFMEHAGRWYLTDMALGVASYHHPHEGSLKGSRTKNHERRTQTQGFTLGRKR